MISNAYDKHFKDANNEFFGGVFDWRWWKAQGIAESNLDHTAVSHCGAVGVMQIMPETWDDIIRVLSFDKAGIGDPELNIRGGVFYMKKLWFYWQSRGINDFGERLKFAQASYNAGMGNISNAWKKIKLDDWDSVALNLSHITGEDNADQTKEYVRRIWLVKCSLR